MSAPQPSKVIRNKKKLRDILTYSRKGNKKIVFTNGCFDILHAGHITYLEKAHQLGDILIVGVNSDSSVKQYKGDKRPINPLEDRMAVLSALEPIDYIIAFKERTPAELISIIRPDFDVKGGDYTKKDLPESAVVEKYGGKVVIIPFYANHSTTTIINKIVDIYGEK